MNKLAFLKSSWLFTCPISGWTHASHPCILHYKDDQWIFAFTCRDNARRSHVFIAPVTVDDYSLHLTGPIRHSLMPGPKGYFDCDGVISGCLIKDLDKIYLYYVGWQNLPDGMWICDTGRAVLDPVSLTLSKEFEGPIIGRDRNHPLFAAATAFLFVPESHVWHTWYNSGISWEKVGDKWHHRYGLHHSTSRNGVDWQYKRGLAIPFKDENEYAFGRPSVLKLGDSYRMWFSHRGSKGVASYRMGHAFSEDAEVWHRDDALAGIDVSSDGWDSEMICYPCVFVRNDDLIMLYNGNGYGRTGIGFAIQKNYEAFL